MLATPLCKRSLKQRSHFNVKMFALSRTMVNRWDSGTGDVIPFPI